MNNHTFYDTQGSYGSLISPKDHAAQRYVEGRLSKITETMLSPIKEAAIVKEDYILSYDGTEEAPSVLPVMGWYPIVNGTLGIGVGLSASIPQFNLAEMNEAMINMLWNKKYKTPMPDFCTGGIIINEKEVRESLEKGSGASAIIRSKIIYDRDNHLLRVVEMPYLTYTNTICKQLNKLLADEYEKNDASMKRGPLGFDDFNDLTGEEPNIEIYLTKGANPQQVINMLYKETSLQNHYGINLTMLHDGKRPRVFTLDEAMREHIKHEIKCLRNIFQYKFNKTEARLHIVQGVLKALENITEVVDIIKNSKNKELATKELMDKFNLTSIQCQSILKMTLAKITGLEKIKYEAEEKTLIESLVRIKKVLTDEVEAKLLIQRRMEQVAKDFGKPRKTIFLDSLEEDGASVLYFTEDGKAFLNKPSSPAIGALVVNGEYMCITKKGYVFRSSEVPRRAKKVFPIDKDDTVINVSLCNDNEFLVLADEEKHFRCISVKGLNKKKTKLSLSNLVDAFTTETKITKAQYKKK